MSIPDISEEIFNAEYETDQQLWFILEKENQDNFILTPHPDGKDVLWIFTNEKDADHYAHIVQKLAPAYKNKDLIAASDKKDTIVDSAKHYKQFYGLISKNRAHDFFKDYEEFLGRYYGFE